MQRWTGRATLGLASLGVAMLASADGRALPQAPAPAPSNSDGLITLAHDLTLTVSEDGPDQPWILTLANSGAAPLGLLADPGLLWFDVTAPGHAIQSCRLSAPLRPSVMQRKSVLVLAPGEQYSRRIDPRFFCFSELGQVLLVPQAKVTPHFGWERERTAVARPAARSRLVKGGSAGPAAAPAGANDTAFVAWRVSGETAPSQAPAGPAEDSDDAEPGSNAPAAWHAPTEGLHSVQGPTLELSGAYASWMASPRSDPPAGVELVLLAGSDAADESDASVTFGLVNSLDRAQQIFVRRELLEYDVHGPDGYFECPSFDVGSPDLGSFTTLRPHGGERAVVRLIEVCPRRSFARPGLYEVRARFSARWSGEDLGLDAFVGQLDSARPVYVRIRSGDLSSFARLLVPADADAAGDVPERAPADTPNDANHPQETPAAPAR